MVRLTSALISAIQDGADITTITSLLVARRDLDQLVGLEVCEKLTKLDLSDNRLSSIEGITLCTQLQWLSVAGNQLTSLKGVENLTRLTVLNASRNQLTSLSEVTVLKELRALILNDNKISKVSRLDRLVNLNTIVLSRNPIRELGNFTSKLLSLKKLSLSNCQVQVIGTSLRSNVALEELRLAHNQLSSLPHELERNGRLSILDIGTNHLRIWSDVQVLGTLHSLVNLNLRGNPLCLEADYEDQFLKRLPHIHILDGHPLHGNQRSKGKNSKSKDSHNGKKDDIDIDNDGQALNEDPEKKSAGKPKHKIPDGDDSSDQPFLDLISFPDPESLSETPDNVKSTVETGKSKKRKDDSGLISVIDVAKGRPFGGKSRKIQLLTEGVQIGIGGPSTWDEPSLIPSNSQVQNTSVTSAVHVENKPYSRWALKKKS